MEIWKDIPEYEGLYQASNKGNIKSLEISEESAALMGCRKRKGRVLKYRGNYSTGRMVGLWKDGVCKDWLVARLVAITFLGAPPAGYTVNHKDGNRFNNCVENLEWLSLADNIRHAFYTGLHKESQLKVELCDGQYLYVFDSCRGASRFLGRSNGYVHGAIKNKRNATSVKGLTYTVKIIS